MHSRVCTLRVYRISPWRSAQAIKMVPSSLVDLAFNTVCDNINTYDGDLLKTCIGPFRIRMREEVLRRSASHHLTCDGNNNHNDNIWAILPCLVKSKSYTRIDTCYMSHMGCKYSLWPNYRFQELIRCLGANTPNLQELIINVCFGIFEYSLEERELASIMQLKHLTILEINHVRVPLSGILDISRRCEKLKTITAGYVEVDETAPLPAIREDFVAMHIEALDIYRRFWISLMMKTTTAPQFATTTTNTHCIRLIHSPSTCRDFSLEQLFAEKLTTLYIDSCNLENIEELVDFPLLPVVNYASIGCGGKSAHVLRCFMKRNGQILQGLTLRNVGIKEEMTLSEILSSCPNLQSLELCACILSGNDAPADAMQQLTRFLWVNGSEYSHDVYSRFFEHFVSAAPRRHLPKPPQY